MKQPTFASLAYSNKKKTTRRERFLAEMDQVIPWARLLKVVRRHYPKPGRGLPKQLLRQPVTLEKVAELADRRLIRHRLGSQLDPREAAHRFAMSYKASSIPGSDSPYHCCMK